MVGKTRKTPAISAVRAGLAALLVAAGVLAVSPAQAQQNLARSPQAVASQSSTLGNYTASRAIDGNTVGTYDSGDLAHTGNGPNDLNQPWWQVDLGAPRRLDTIRLFNRTDCCADRMSNFYVFVSDVPFTGATVAASQAQQGVDAFHTPGQMGRPTAIPINRNGRYIRVQLAGNGETINMAEVEVIGAEIDILDSAVPRPGVTLSTTTTRATAGTPFTVAVKFTAEVAGFATAADINVINGTAAAPVQGADAATYTVAITPNRAGPPVGVRIMSRAARSVKGNNASTASNSLSLPVAAAPSGAQGAGAGGGSGGSAQGAVNRISFTLGRSSDLFTIDFVDRNGNGILDNRGEITRASGQNCTAGNFSALAGYNGPAGRWNGFGGASHGYSCGSSSSGASFRNVRIVSGFFPRPVLSAPARQARPGQPFPVTVQFVHSDTNRAVAVSGFSAADINVINGTAAAPVAGADATYTVAVTPTEAGRPVLVEILANAVRDEHDLNGNAASDVLLLPVADAVPDNAGGDADAGEGDSALATFSQTAVSVAEAGGTATYTVVLTGEPTGDITITPQSSDATAATVAPAGLTFDATNWNTAQTVTITGVNDDVDNANDTRSATISHTIAGDGYYNARVDSVEVTVTDDDTAAVTVSAAALTVAEAAGSAT